MKFIWLAFLIELITIALFSDYISPDFIIVLVFIHSIISMLILFTQKKHKVIFLLAYITRLVLMFWDLYASHIYSLPNSGSDTEAFFRQSIYFSENLDVLFISNGELYSKVLGVIFFFVGPHKILGQYINVLLGLSVTFILYKIFTMLDLSKRVVSVTLFIAAIFPNSLIMSVVFLREIITTFLVSASLYYFVKWYKGQLMRNIIIAFVILGLASTFHSGVIGISLGYIFAYLFYQKESNNFKFSANTFLAFIVIIAIFVLSFTVLNNFIFGKFLNVEGIDDIFETATPRGEGGSAYLTGLEINSLGQFILFIPIKSIYFLFSPFPWDWRGVFDIFTFFFDSMLYLLTIYNSFKYRKLLRKNPLIVSLVIMLIGAVLIFATGVSNTGTAMRHRQKLLPIFVIIIANIFDSYKCQSQNKLNSGKEYKNDRCINNYPRI